LHLCSTNYTTETEDNSYPQSHFFPQSLEMTRLLPPVNPLATHYIARCLVGSQPNNAPSSQERTMETQGPKVCTVRESD